MFLYGAMVGTAAYTTVSEATDKGN